MKKAIDIFGNDYPLEPLPQLEVKERCGVLIKSSNAGYLWVIAPFWDDSEPILLNTPDRKIDAIIVLNNNNHGCLPLSSFFASDNRLPMDCIYVINSKKPHDWHIKYKDSEAVNKLISVKQIPKVLELDYLNVSSYPASDFVKIDWKNPDTLKKMELYIGQNIYYPVNDNKEKASGTIKPHYYIGNFDVDKFETSFKSILDKGMQIGMDNMHVMLSQEWIHPNNKATIQSFNLMGLPVYCIGKRQSKM